MSNFRIGEKVVAKENHPNGTFKKGDEFIVDGFCCCPRCGRSNLYLKGLDRIVNSECNTRIANGCGHITTDTRQRYSERRFEKAISIAEGIEYRLKVTIPELTEIKEVQHQ